MTIILNHVELLGFNDPNDILLKTRIRLMQDDIDLYYLYAPCHCDDIKCYYYHRVEKIKRIEDAINVIDHLMSIRKDSLQKIIKDRGFVEDIIEGISFDFKLDDEIFELSNYIENIRT